MYDCICCRLPANRHKQLICLLGMNMERAETWHAPPGLLTESHRMVLQMRQLLNLGPAQRCGCCRRAWSLCAMGGSTGTVRQCPHLQGGRQCTQHTCGRKGEAGRGQGQGAAWVLAQSHPGLAKAGPNPVTIKVEGGLWQWRSQLALAGGSLQLPSAPSIV